MSLLLSKCLPPKPQQFHFYLSHRSDFHKNFIWKKGSRGLKILSCCSESSVKVLLACNSVWFYDWKVQTIRIFMGQFEPLFFNLQTLKRQFLAQAKGTNIDLPSEYSCSSTCLSREFSEGQQSLFRLCGKSSEKPRQAQTAINVNTHKKPIC